MKSHNTINQLQKSISMKTKIKFLHSSMMNRMNNAKSSFNSFMMIAISAFILASCQTTSASVSENRTINSDFFGVILKTNAQVILSQGDEASVRVEGSVENVASVKTTIENGALVIDGNNKFPVTIFVTIDEISLIEVNGNGKIFSNQLINSDMLLLKVSGSGTINVEVRTLSLGMIVKGNGKIYAKGSTGDSFIRVTGNGQVMTRNLDSIKPISEANVESRSPKATSPSNNKRGVLKIHQ